MRPGDQDWLEDRIRGCLAFAALGDAAGEPVEQCTRAEVLAFGDPITHLWGEGGEAREGLGITDDTEQLEALARVLVETRGDLDLDAWRAALLHWFRTTPSPDKVGPTTRAALEGRALEPARAMDDRLGVTNGSAMRAAPCGLVHPADLERAVELAWLTSSVTHDTQVAGAAAGAIAAGVATALRPGSGVEEVTEACVLGAALGNGLGVRHGRTVALPRVSDRIGLAVDEARAARDLNEALERIEAAVGTSMLAFESVPAAVGALAATGGDPLATVRFAVQLGGDTDTIAAMAGALAGALHGFAAQEPDDRALLELAAPHTLLELSPALAAIAARP